MLCSMCGEIFLVNDAEEPPDDSAGSIRLDSLRIQRIRRARTADYRARSHAIIGAVVCAVGAIEAIHWGVSSQRESGLDGRVVICGVAAAIALPGAIFCSRRAIAIHREVSQLDRSPNRL